MASINLSIALLINCSLSSTIILLLKHSINFCFDSNQGFFIFSISTILITSKSIIVLNTSIKSEESAK